MKRTRSVPSKYNKKCTHAARISLPLILLCVIGLDGFGLDNDGGIAAGEGAAFGGDGAGDIARGESQCHGNGGSDGHDEVLDGLPQPLFLYIG